MVLQETGSSNLKITNERLEKLSGEIRNIKKSKKFTQKQLKEEANVVKKDVEILQKNLN